MIRLVEAKGASLAHGGAEKVLERRFPRLPQFASGHISRKPIKTSAFE
jgi:hypothetical protein